jgi:hypothetical protein
MSRITQRGATGPISIQANGQFQSDTDTSLDTLVGSRWDLSDGREVILVKAGAAAIAPGVLYQDAAIVANHQGLATTAFTAYSNNGNVPPAVTVTLGATAATSNEYRGGFAIVASGTGAGQTLRIASHPAAAASASLVVTLEDGPNTALDTTSVICLIPAHGANVIINPTARTGAIAGAGLYTIAATSYGFLVSKGVTAILADGAVAVGSAVSPSNAVAGAVEAGVIAQGFVGTASQAGVDTQYRAIDLSL